jgi:hypothetical protein
MKKAGKPLPSSTRKRRAITWQRAWWISWTTSSSSTCSSTGLQLSAVRQRHLLTQPDHQASRQPLAQQQRRMKQRQKKQQQAWKASSCVIPFVRSRYLFPLPRASQIDISTPELTPVSRRQFLQGHGTHSITDQTQRGEAHMGRHAANLAIFAFGEHEFQPRSRESPGEIASADSAPTGPAEAQCGARHRARS